MRLYRVVCKMGRVDKAILASIDGGSFHVQGSLRAVKGVTYICPGEIDLTQAVDAIYQITLTSGLVEAVGLPV